MKTILSTSILTLICTSIFASDPPFTQIQGVPLFYNPSFAGSIEKSRVAATYRNQWPGLAEGNFVTGYLSYDQPVNRLKGGLGLMTIYDIAGTSLKTTRVDLAYSPKFMVADKFTIAPSILLGYGNSHFDLSEVISSQPEPNIVENRSYLNLGTGILANTAKWHVGFAIDHLNQPDISHFNGSKSKLAAKYIIHGGYIMQKSEDAPWALYLNLLYQQQNSLTSSLVSASGRYKWLMLGGGVLPSNIGDNILIMVGYYSKRILISYHHQIDSNNNADHLSHMETYGIHEIGIRYLFSMKKAAPAVIQPAQ